MTAVYRLIVVDFVIMSACVIYSSFSLLADFNHMVISIWPINEKQVFVEQL